MRPTLTDQGVFNLVHQLGAISIAMFCDLSFITMKLWSHLCSYLYIGCS